jgi:hypothetical protein
MEVLLLSFKTCHVGEAKKISVQFFGKYFGEGKILQNFPLFIKEKPAKK